MRTSSLLASIVAFGLLAGLTSCTWFGSDPADTATSSAALDTVQAERIGPRVPPAFQRAPADALVPADTLAPPVAVADPPEEALGDELDSLRREIAQLSALVAGLAEATSLADTTLPVDVARPDSATVAAADTALAAKAGDRLRETAEDVRNIGLRTAWALLVLVVFFFVVKGSVWILETLAERDAARRLFFKKLVPVIRLFVWLVAVYYIVSSIYGIRGDQLLAASAALGVAIGFAAQDILKNIFGGILIILDQPFQVGDKIEVGGTYGEVISIGLRSTRIVTPDDNLVSVPNAQVVDGQVSNANAGALDCQVVTHLYLPGWVDPARAKSIAYAAAANSKFVYLDKPIVVLLKDEFKETFLTHVVVKAYVLDTRYENALVSDVTETAKGEFIRQGLLRAFEPPLKPTSANGHEPAGEAEAEA